MNECLIMFENAGKCPTQYIILGNKIQSQEILEITGNIGKCKIVFQSAGKH